jgi:hypothetical protein
MKVNKELDTYPLVDCEPGVKRKMADCRLRLEAARYEAERVVTRLLRDHDAWGQVSREGRPKEKIPRPGQNSGAVEMSASPRRRPCRSGLRACGWRGTAQAREDRKKRDQGPLGASRRKGPPRVRR